MRITDTHAHTNITYTYAEKDNNVRKKGNECKSM